jgi:Mechanosensitive ion channel, conserved TM helix
LVASIQVAQSLQQALNGLLGFIPRLLGFLVILIVGFFIARAVKALVTTLLRKAKLDHALHSGQSGQYVSKISPQASPAALIGGVVFWLIFLFVLTAAIGALKIPSVTAFMNQVLNYLPNVIAAVIIFVIAGAIAAAVGGAVAKLMGDTPTGKVVGTAVPVLIMGIAVFMILNQLRIAPAIVQITYIALLGSVALGSALAFGLGGREVAGQMLASAYEKGLQNAGQVKQDMQTGRQRGQDQADRARDDAEQKLDTDDGPAARRREDA